MTKPMVQKKQHTILNTPSRFFTLMAPCHKVKLHDQGIADHAFPAELRLKHFTICSCRYIARTDLVAVFCLFALVGAALLDRGDL